MSLTPFHVCCPITHLTICRCDHFSRQKLRDDDQSDHSSALVKVNENLAQFAAHVKKTFQLYTHTNPQYWQELGALLTDHQKENQEDSGRVSPTVIQSHRFVVPAKFVKQLQPNPSSTVSSHPVDANGSSAITSSVNPTLNASATPNAASSNVASSVNVSLPMNPTLISALQSYLAHTGQPPTSDPQKLAQLYQQLKLQYSVQQSNNVTNNNLQASSKAPAQQQPTPQQQQRPQTPQQAPSQQQQQATSTASSSTSTPSSQPRKRGRPRKKKSCAECEKGDSLAQPPDTSLLQCVNCGHCIHTFCHEPKLDHLAPGHRVIWRCEECKVCETCGESGDEVKLLICESCDRGFHTYCLNPPLKDIPKNSWNCSQCLMAKRSMMQQESYNQQMAAQQAVKQQMALAEANVITPSLSSNQEGGRPSKRQRRQQD